uniref:DNA-directed RNA polymerase E subunit 1 n=1 Tax=Lygus hesperus TaxID=30085 RepID=A0A0A9VXJ8_LYGHE
MDVHYFLVGVLGLLPALMASQNAADNIRPTVSAPELKPSTGSEPQPKSLKGEKNFQMEGVPQLRPPAGGAPQKRPLTARPNPKNVRNSLVPKPNPKWNPLKKTAAGWGKQNSRWNPRKVPAVGWGKPNSKPNPPKNTAVAWQKQNPRGIWGQQPNRWTKSPISVRPSKTVMGSVYHKKFNPKLVPKGKPAPYLPPNNNQQKRG